MSENSNSKSIKPRCAFVVILLFIAWCIMCLIHLPRSHPWNRSGMNASLRNDHRNGSVRVRWAPRRLSVDNSTSSTTTTTAAELLLPTMDEAIKAAEHSTDCTSSCGDGRRHPPLVERFSLHRGGGKEEEPAHPSRPYYVLSDAATGESVMSLADGDADHPLGRLADVRAPREEARDLVFFFHVPKAHGGAVKNIMTNCFSLRRTEKLEDPESLTFVRGVLNIDTQTRKGLAQARSAGIIDSGLVDVIVSSYFFEGLLLFAPHRQGRAFTILRHPVHLAMTLFRFHKRQAPHIMHNITLLQHLNGDHYRDNWVVRSLTNDKNGQLTEEHLLVAKGILARKFVVGIADYLEETIKRLITYYGWNADKQKDCIAYFLNKHSKSTSTTPTSSPLTSNTITPVTLDKQQNKEQEEEEFEIERGSDEWKIVADINKYDMELYYYALELFTKQGSTMFQRPYVDKEGNPIDFAKLKKEREEEELKQLMQQWGLT